MQLVKSVSFESSALDLMKTHFNYIQTFLLSRAVARGLILLAVHCLWVSQLEASCGDYLHVGKSIETKASDIDVTARSPLKVPAPFPSRCHGANCQQQVPLPAPPLPNTNSSDWQKSAVQITDLENGISHSSQQKIDAHCQPPSTGFPYRLKRPPRA